MTRWFDAPAFYFIRRNPRQYGTLVLVVLVSGAIETLTIAALFPLFSVVLGSSSDLGGPLLRSLDEFVSGFPLDRLTVALALYLLIVPTNVISKLVREFVIARTTALVTYDTKQRVFTRYLTAPHQFLLERRQGDLTYRITTAPLNLTSTLMLASYSTSLAVNALFTTVLLFTIEWRITLFMVVLGAIFFRINRMVAGRLSVNAGREKAVALSAGLDVVNEFVTGGKEINVARSGQAWLDRFQMHGELYRRFFVRDVVIAAVPGLVMEFAILALAGIVAVAARIVAPDQFFALLPVLAVYVYAVRQLIGSVSAVSQNLLRMAGLSVDVEMLRVALEEPYPEVREGERTDIGDWRELRFDHVSFSYRTRPGLVLDDVSFRIPRGRTVAIAGPSGAGKSTIVYLLLRLFDPTVGRLTADSTNLEVFQRSAWLRRIAYVSQEGFVYNATIADNIAFGQPFTMDEIVAAARTAYVDEFVRQLPQGYRTFIGERGTALSAGERQRIAIARALVRRPELLVLDEVTSALDSASEALIQRGLDDIRGRCTVLIVAHRLSTIRGADEIIILDRGHIIERGTHEELVACSGLYAELVRLQERAESILR